MNTRTAILASLTALALGVVTYFALRPHAPVQATPPATPTRLSLAASATQLSVSDFAETTTLTAAPDLDTWLIRTPPDGTPWPAEPGAVQGALRLVGELARSTPQTAKPPAPANCTAVTLTIPKQPNLALLITHQSLGGKTKAYELTADPARALEFAAPTQTAELLTPRNVSAWRRADLLAAPGTPTELRISTRSSTLAFKQVDGKWTLMLPVPAPVDTAAMKELLAATLPAKRFLAKGEHAAPTTSPLDAFATITRTTRTATESGTSLITTEVTIGAAADTAQETFYAAASARRSLIAAKPEDAAPEVLWGPVHAILDGSSITAIARTPQYYVAKRAIQAPAADITRLRILPPTGAFDLANPLREPEDQDAAHAAFIRTLDGWTNTNASSKLDTDEAARVGAVLAILCETPAARIHVEGLSTPVSPTCSIAVSSVNGGLLDVVGVATDEPGTTVYIRSGRVIREYTTDSAGTALAALRAWSGR